MPTRELPHSRGGNRFDLLVHSAAVLLDEVAGQQGNILRAFAQRWDADWEHVQAIVQVAAEFAILHHFFQVAMGGRYQSHVDLLRSVAAQPFKLTFLQSAQQLGLNLDRNIPDLIEEERALVG